MGAVAKILVSPQLAPISYPNNMPPMAGNTKNKRTFFEKIDTCVGGSCSFLCDRARILRLDSGFHVTFLPTLDRIICPDEIVVLHRCRYRGVIDATLVT